MKCCVEKRVASLATPGKSQGSKKAHVRMPWEDPKVQALLRSYLEAGAGAPKGTTVQSKQMTLPAAAQDLMDKMPGRTTSSAQLCRKLQSMRRREADVDAAVALLLLGA